MRKDFWQKLPAFDLSCEDVGILYSAKAYKTRLLQLIAQAKNRIVITALYLQDDASGREILTALHQASLAKPNLEVTLYVDYHRAQRGLIGEKKNEGNATFYHEFANKYQSNVKIYGVPVKAREFLGVLHLKGFVFDNILLYSGASLNDMYLHQNERYRLDRYFEIEQADICNAITQFMSDVILNSAAISRLDTRPITQFSELKQNHKQLISKLKKIQYPSANEGQQSGISARLFLGFGRRGNQLNRVIKSLFELTDEELVLYTPYFNFPAPLLRILRKLLKQGKKVTIVVGDKTANDFYISPDKEFSKVGALPYLYETILRQFAKRQGKFIEQGLLKIYLWRHEDNSFHLKGLNVDDKRYLLTGHNLNPRAWGLDIENGLLIEDPNKLLAQDINREKQQILSHCTLINSYLDLETVEDYPVPVRKLIGQAKRVKADIIIKRFI